MINLLSGISLQIFILKIKFIAKLLSASWLSQIEVRFFCLDWPLTSGSSIQIKLIKPLPFQAILIIPTLLWALQYQFSKNSHSKITTNNAPFPSFSYGKYWLWKKFLIQRQKLSNLFGQIMARYFAYLKKKFSSVAADRESLEEWFSVYKIS